MKRLLQDLWSPGRLISSAQQAAGGQQRFHMLSFSPAPIARELSPSSSLIRLSMAREEEMYDLHGELVVGRITLAQAFRQLGLGFDPAVSEEATAFAMTSVDRFVDLFNACVNMQAPSPRPARCRPQMDAKLNSDGARQVTIYSGGAPDDLGDVFSAFAVADFPSSYR